MPGTHTCRICGIGIRDSDDVIWAHDEPLHLGCTDAHKKAPRRRLGMWAAMGSGGQMAIGDVQRDTPT